MLYLLLSLQEEFKIFFKKNNWEDIFVMLHSPVRKVLGPNLTRGDTALSPATAAVPTAANNRFIFSRVVNEISQQFLPSCWADF